MQGLDNLHGPGNLQGLAKTKARPRDAATLIIIDRSRALPRVLMGRRRPDQVFLPNKFVFPGGRLDKADRFVKPKGELSKADLSNLLFDMKGRASVERARTLALTAIRESFEETGLLFGSRFAAEGERGQKSSNPVWQKVFDHGLMPSLAGLRFMARAITPPGRPRRYDTRFFCVDAARIIHKEPPIDNELLDQDWFGLDEMRMLDLPHITRAIVEDLDVWLETGGYSSSGDRPVPYYYFANGAHERRLIRYEGERS